MTETKKPTSYQSIIVEDGDRHSDEIMLAQAAKASGFYRKLVASGVALLLLFGAAFSYNNADSSSKKQEAALLGASRVSESLYNLAVISDNVYNIEKGVNEMNVKLKSAGLDYTVIPESIFQLTGIISMAVYQNKDHRVLAFKGTELDSGSDILHDILLFIGGPSSRAAVQPTLRVARDLVSFYSVDLVTGHSLGGYVTEILATNDGISGASFCGPGVNGPFTSLGGSAHSGFQNIQFEHDPIGNVNIALYQHVQWSVFVEGTSHFIEDMVDYFKNHKDITNTNVVSRSESWPTGYYYPK